MTTSAHSVKLPSLDTLKHVHIIGVCGTLMGAFAAYLKRQGLEVTGSDQNVYPPMSDVLAKAGVRLFSGYRAENLSEMPARPDLVVIGNVIQAVNLEARAAIDGGYAYTSLPEAMEHLMLQKTRNILASGTHGKTTTASMAAHVLHFCGEDPSYFIGGVPTDLPFSFNVTRVDAGRPFVLEGDEYDTAFWDKVPKFNHYLPDDVILTSVEFDHADIYKDLDAVKNAFRGLVKRIRSGGCQPGSQPGRLIACTDYSAVVELIDECAPSVRVMTYGRAQSAGGPEHYRVENLKSVGGLLTFDVTCGGARVETLELQMPGEHNALNALAVWIECRELGLESAKIKEALSVFRGVKRRQEARGEVRGVLVIDDFAHHPTAVRETLQALKAKYEGRRLVAVFEPRSATSRRKVFQDDYARAFGAAEVVFIATPYDQSKIPAADQFSTTQLVEEMRKRGSDASEFAKVDEGVRSVAQAARAGDVVAVLSNGGFEGFIPKLLDALKT